MRYESSYGIVPVKFSAKSWKVLLVQHGKGSHWSFPKGHKEQGESAKEAAIRELFEETGLAPVQFLRDEPFKETYFFTFHQEKIHKEVSYFLAEVEGKVRIQKEEISAYKWLPFDAAHEHITFSQGKSICSQAAEYLRDHGKRD